MIHTILDTDLYKFTTSYAYIKLFPYAMGTFSFKDRDDTAYTDTFLKELQEAVDSLAQTVLTVLFREINSLRQSVRVKSLTVM